MVVRSGKDDSYAQMLKVSGDKIHISFSEFSLYNQCAHKHLVMKYLKLDEEPPSIHLFFGNAIHSAIELAVTDELSVDDRVDHFRTKFRKEMMDNLLGDPSFDEMEDFIDQGVNILKTLDLIKLFDEYEIVSVEEPLYEVIDGRYHFKGFIDLVARHKETGRILIVDWKTSGQKWDLNGRYSKLKDFIFLCQMRFYKYFWAKKNEVDLDNVDCVYFVLNRLQNNKDPNGGFGELQRVDINATEEEIFTSLTRLADTVEKIHIHKQFRKIKFEGDERGCKFCKFKGGTNKLCNSDPNQYKYMLLENKKM